MEQCMSAPRINAAVAKILAVSLVVAALLTAVLATWTDDVASRHPGSMAVTVMDLSPTIFILLGILTWSVLILQPLACHYETRQPARSR
jgi:hypothetical protein